MASHAESSEASGATWIADACLERGTSVQSSSRRSAGPVSIIRAPDKQDRWDVVDDVNRRVRTYAVGRANVEYLEVNHVLVNADGSPRLEFYMADGLHLRAPAYEALARVLKPALSRALTPSR